MHFKIIMKGKNLETIISSKCWKKLSSSFKMDQDWKTKFSKDKNENFLHKMPFWDENSLKSQPMENSIKFQSF